MISICCYNLPFSLCLTLLVVSYILHRTHWKSEDDIRVPLLYTLMSMTSIWSVFNFIWFYTSLKEWNVPILNSDSILYPKKIASLDFHKHMVTAPRDETILYTEIWEASTFSVRVPSVRRKPKQHFQNSCTVIQLQRLYLSRYIRHIDR